MNHKKNHESARTAEPDLRPVHIKFNHPTATSVCVAGTFNQWQPQADALHLERHGHWLKEMAMVPGSYEYCLVVDGQWMPDPLAKDTVPNPFGGVNSILQVRHRD